MIGILAKLAKAAKLAQTAEAAIDIASNKLGPGGEAGAKPAAPADDVPSAYRALLDAGVADVRELLTAEEAGRLIGKRIRSASLAATDDCIVCDYHCKDRAGTVLGVHLSKTMPWEGFDHEIAKKELFDDLGDAAFRGGRQIYVKTGDCVFWIHTAGEVMVETAVEAARLVVGRLRGDAS
jgi:hypothetical protein